MIELTVLMLLCRCYIPVSLVPYLFIKTNIGHGPRKRKTEITSEGIVVAYTFVVAYTL